MKVILFISVLLLALLVVGDFKMTFSPFIVEMKDWAEALKFILTVVLFTLACGWHEVKGFKEGYSKALDDALEALEEVKKEYQDDGNGQK